MSLVEQRTHVGLLRISAAADDPLAVQMRGQAALRPLDLRPAAMPPHAILCIRRMTDPLPRALDLRTSYGSRATEWERAARVAVGRALSSAVRPLHDGGRAAEAEAVLFDDRAELLACAARDVARGAPPAWYWEQALPALDIGTVVRELARVPRYLPAIVELLVRSGDAVPFARLLSREAIVLLAQSVGVNAATCITGDTAATPAPRAPVPRDGSRAAATLPLADAPELASSEVVNALTIEQHLFLAVMLTLHRAPGIAPGEAFARQVLAARLSGKPVESTQPAATAIPAAAQPFARDARDTASQSREARPVARTQPGAASAASALTTQPQTTASSVAKTGAHIESLRADRQPHADATTAAEPSPAPLAAAPDTQTLLTATLSTEHAGIFFLLDAALALGYYRDPPVRRLDLHPWDFLAQAARALVPTLDDEPLFALLDELAPPRRRRRRISRPLLARVRKLLTALDLPPRLLIRRYGRITVTPVNLDVAFSLDAHPVEIRLAGLDRDPGWIPDAGRHVAYHFD